MVMFKQMDIIKKIAVQTFVLCCCLIWSTYALTLKTKNSRDGTETFLKCKTTVTLECTDQGYTGVLSWKYDSTEVASCLVSNCQDTSNNNGFKFVFDTANVKFQWILNPVKDEYKNKLFECFDGTNRMNVTATFDEKGLKSFGFAIIIAVVIFFNIVAVIGTILYNRIKGQPIFPPRNESRNKAVDENKTETGTEMMVSGGTGRIGTNNTKNKSRAGQEICSTWLHVILVFIVPLVFFVVGIIFTVILILVTRFSEGSVIEVYEDICGWEILLILFGIYFFIACCLLLALLIVVIKRQKDSEQDA